MKLILIILVIAAVGAAVLYLLKRKGKIADANNNLIPDNVEAQIKKATADVKARAKAVKKEVADVKTSADDLRKQVNDVVEAAKGQKRRGRKPGSTNSNTRRKQPGTGAKHYYSKKK